MEDVIAGSGMRGVAALVSVDNVISITALDGVVPLKAKHKRIFHDCLQHIIAAVPVDIPERTVFIRYMHLDAAVKLKVIITVFPVPAEIFNDKGIIRSLDPDGHIIFPGSVNQDVCRLQTLEAEGVSATVINNDIFSITFSKNISVISFAAIENIISGSAIQYIVAGISIEDVITGTARDCIVASASNKQVISVAAGDRVIASVAIDDVGYIGTIQVIALLIAPDGSVYGGIDQFHIFRGCFAKVIPDITKDLIAFLHVGAKVTKIGTDVREFPF